MPLAEIGVASQMEEKMAFSLSWYLLDGGFTRRIRRRTQGLATPLLMLLGSSITSFLSSRLKPLPILVPTTTLILTPRWFMPLPRKGSGLNR